MLLLDYNALCIAAISVQRGPIDRDMIRHMILNSIRMHTKNHKEKYGYPVICCDSSSWRRDIFPQYKANRRKSRDQSPEESERWDMIFETIAEIREDIRNNFPYKVIHIDKCEADDIIGTLAELSNEFGHGEDVMIISGDKDFVQLQRYNNVRQYSPVKKKFIEEKHPRTFLLEHILRGDSGDGVPNVLSDDDVIVDNRRQHPITKKFVTSILEASEPSQAPTWNTEIARNFDRNKKLIDLSQTPADLKQEIINSYVDQKVAHKTKVMGFLVKNRMKMLVESCGDFL